MLPLQISLVSLPIPCSVFGQKNIDWRSAGKVSRHQEIRKILQFTPSFIRHFLFNQEAILSTPGRDWGKLGPGWRQNMQKTKFFR